MWFQNNLNIWVDPSKMKRSKLAEFENNFVFQNVFYTFLDDALNRYDIENLPPTCSKRVILQSLLWNGTFFFFKFNGAWLALPGLPDGSGLNLYADYAGAYVYSANGYNKKIALAMPGADMTPLLQKTNSGAVYKDGVGVMIRENRMMFPFINIVSYYSWCVADTMRTLDVCRKNAKRPYIITAEQSVLKSVMEWMNKRDNNEEYIISTGVFPADKVAIQPLQSNPEFTHTASELIDWYTQQYREHCGFDNLGCQVDKKGENLQSGEITYNEEYTNSKTQNIIDYMNEQLKLFNDMSGYHVRVVPKKTHTGEKKKENGEEESKDALRVQDVE